MNKSPLRKILISSGELSGDEHAGALVRELRAINPEVELRAMGGRNLSSAGAKIIVDAERSGSVMGFQELFSKAAAILNAFRSMRRELASFRPDLLIVVDYPDFNLRLAAAAKRLGIPVVYFIPPKIWAWRSGRLKKISRVTDLVLSIFPFEESFYTARGFSRLVYVGHPFTSTISPMQTTAQREEFLRSLQLSPSAPTIALFPGSRKAEVERHLEPLLLGFADARKTHPEIQGVLCAAASLPSNALQAAEKYAPNLRITHNNSIEVLRYCDAGILKSGTTTLQAAFCGLPFSVIYRASALSAALVRRFVKLDQFSLVNIIRRDSVTEILQEELTTERIGREIERLLFNKPRRQEIQRNLSAVCSALSGSDARIPAEITGAYARAAYVIQHFDFSHGAVDA